MRTIAFVCLIVVAVACGTQKNAGSQNSFLNGTWIPVQQEIGGNALPKAAFEKQKLIIDDSLYTVIAESVDKGVVRINGGQMDIYGRDGANAGKHFTAIYKMENGQLVVCYNLEGTSYPGTFETRGMPSRFLVVYRKG